MAFTNLARFEDLDLFKLGAPDRLHEGLDVRERLSRLVVPLFLAACADNGIDELVEGFDVVLGFESYLLVDSTNERVSGTTHWIGSAPMPNGSGAQLSADPLRRPTKPLAPANPTTAG